MSELIIGMGDNNGHVGKKIDGFQGFMEDLALAKEIKSELFPWNFCEAKYLCTKYLCTKYLCIATTWLGKADKEITYGSGCN